MDFLLPPEDDPRRIAVRDWIAAHPNPTNRDVAERVLGLPRDIDPHAGMTWAKTRKAKPTPA